MSSAAVESPTRDRILDALVQCIVENGMRKVTVDDVAQRAELSRVTLYSYFSGKQAMIQEAVVRETERFLAELERVAESHETPEERLVETFAFAYRHLRAHPLVQRMVRFEPELLASHMAREAPALVTARAWVADRFAHAAEGTLPPEEVEQAAELVVRTVHSLIIVPESTFGLDDPDGPQRYARRWLLPAIAGPPAR
ncbi:MAG TPA: TetR/AcrR family transcriptional regulator [Solirubrobacteraceae bacterium]|jgi:AcrR family transcriptional regulator|nr:TetR/AcrR family transcriptional regulator [Solirubrobacteraceae bacterium]